MSYTQITALPDVPSRADPTTFADKGDAFLGALPTFRTEANALSSELNILAQTNAGLSSDLVLASNFKGSWSSLTGSLTPPALVFHNNSYWLLKQTVANITTQEPSDSNTTYWQPYVSSQNSFNNFFINPEFLISQEFGSSSTSIPVASTPKYFVDQWYAISAGASVTAQRVSGISERQYSVRITGATGNTSVIFGQRIEAVNCTGTKNKIITVSFKSKASTTRTVTWSAYYANSLNDFSTKILIATGDLSITTSVSNFNFSFNAGNFVENGLAIEFSTSSLGASATIDYDQMQIEKSSLVTQFEPKSPLLQLLECQRYWENGYVRVQMYSVSTPIVVYGFFKASKISAPTMTQSFALGGVATSAFITNPSITGFEYGVFVSGSGLAYAQGTWTASARL